MTTFHLGRIEVGKLTKGSTVLSGTNVRTNHLSRRKINDGFGAVKGETTVVHDCKSVVFDKDVFDMLRK